MQRNKRTKAQRQAKEREDRIRVMEPGDAEVVAASITSRKVRFLEGRLPLLGASDTSTGDKRIDALSRPPSSRGRIGGR